MKEYTPFIYSIIILFSLLQFTGCGTSYKDMTEDEFWNENEGRYRSKTDSSYIYQVEMFNTKADYKDIGYLDEPIVTSNFTKILLVNEEASLDTAIYYTIRITQKKQGYERITKPRIEDIYLRVNGIPLLLISKIVDIKYVPPLSSAEYGYKNGYYYCDIMCPLTYEEFKWLANALKIEGTIMVNTSLVQIDKSADGEIKFVSEEKPGDAEIINRFFNTHPRK